MYLQHEIQSFLGLTRAENSYFANPSLNQDQSEKFLKVSG